MNNSNVIISNLHRSYFTVFPQGAVITPRAHGVDVSKYDLYFEPATAQGQLDFVIQRISYRLTQDEAFDDLVDGVHEVPVRGGYHYLNSGTDWRAQADKFISIVSGYDYHFSACDFEDAYNVLSNSFAYDAWKWIHYVQDRTGKPALLYTSPNLYKLYITPSQSVYGIDWNTVKLWTAQWFFTPNPNENPTMPAGRTGGWTFWQYTDRGDGLLYGVARPTACDLDVFNGTPQQLRDFLNLGDVTPPPNGGTMPKYEAVALGDNTRLRFDHSTANPYVASYPKGTKFHGDIVWICQENIYDSAGLLLQKQGDQWLQVTDVNGVAKAGFVAIIHKGGQICAITPPVETTPGTPPTTTLPDLAYTITIDGGLAYESATITGVLKAKQ